MSRFNKSKKEATKNLRASPEPEPLPAVPTSEPDPESQAATTAETEPDVGATIAEDQPKGKRKLARGLSRRKKGENNG
jgi:hypothetical protein